MHSILERQLRALEVPTDGQTLPSLEQWTSLLDGVGRAYADADDGRSALERSIEHSSTEMNRLHEKLASERDGLRALIGCLGDALLVVDGDGVIQLANPEAGRLIGRPIQDLLGRPLREVVACRPGEKSPFQDCLLRGACRSDETSFVNVSGDVVEVAITVNPVIHDGAPEGATIVFRDIAARKQLEGSLRHAQKLESVGRLAAGIAHEINTPVQFVNDNVHFLKGSFHTLRAFLDQLKHRVSDPEWDEAALEADWDYLQDEIPKSAAQTLEGLQRIATIVQSMKNFAHNDRGERTIVDLNAALRNTLIVARHELKTVAVAVDDFGDIPKVVCCTGDINQVFLNLVVNAAHAVADVVEQTGTMGRVCIATRRDGDDVVVSISDTGGGIPENVRAHLFEPFFTTKQVGRGSGQGLALARSLIVNKHGGQLTFETEIGVGTTFHVRLPIEGSDPEPSAP